MDISTVKFDLIEVLRHEKHTLPEFLEMHTRLQEPVANASSFSSLNGLLLYKGRLVVGKDSSLKSCGSKSSTKDQWEVIQVYNKLIYVWLQYFYFLGWHELGC